MLFLLLSYLETEEDKQQFEDIYLAYRKQMVFFAVSILNDNDGAEDAVGNVFFNIASRNWKTVKGIENSIDLRNYLLKATKNSSLNIIKRNKRLVNCDSIDELRFLGKEIISDEDFLDTICTNADYQDVVAAIMSLDEKYRNALYYHFAMDLAVNRTANLLGLPISTVQKQLVRGKKLLLESLGLKEPNNNGNEKRRI